MWELVPLLLFPIQAIENKKKRKPEIDYLKYPEADVVVQNVMTRYLKGLGTNIFVIGLSGTGKSSTSQRLGELICEKRKEEGLDNEVFIVDSLLHLVRAVRNAKMGDVIVVEEVSVLFPSRRAMSKENVAIGRIMDTIRKKRIALISNAPIWGSIDSHMRALGHIIVETLAIKKRQKIVMSKFHRLQTNPRSGKTYTHTFQRAGRDVKLMYTQMPNKEKWEEYEKQKDKFMEELYESLEIQERKKIKKFVDDKEHVTAKLSRPLTERQEQIYKLLKKGMTQVQIAKELGTTQPSVCSNVKFMRNKGADI